MAIGLSTGCFYRWDEDIYEQIEYVQKMNVDTIQIIFASLDEIESFRPFSLEMRNIYVHLPWKNIKYGYNSETNSIISKIQEIQDKMAVKAFIIESQCIRDLNAMSVFDILVENSNALDKFGSIPEDIRQIRGQYGSNFVFDIAHLYNFDREFRYIERMLDAMKERLMLVHASGFRQGNPNSRIYDSENREIISEWLRKLGNLPIIIESQLDSPLDAEKEIECVREIIGE